MVDSVVNGWLNRRVPGSALISTGLTMEMVMRDQIDNWGTTDLGQILRLQKSLSLTQPSKRRIKELSLSLTPPRYRIEF